MNGVFPRRGGATCACARPTCGGTGASDRTRTRPVARSWRTRRHAEEAQVAPVSCEPDPGGDGDGAAAPSSDSGAPSNGGERRARRGRRVRTLSRRRSADAQFLVCVTAAPDAIAVGFEWQRQGQNGRKIFTTRLGLDTSAISYQPSESTSMATSGPQQRCSSGGLSNHQLKQSPIKYLTLDEGTCYTAHAWTDDMRLVATTTSGHVVVVVDDNEQAQLIRVRARPAERRRREGHGQGPRDQHRSPRSGAAS